MDDGSLSHHEKQKDRTSFATCNFSDTECNILIDALKTFGFKNPILFKDTNGYPRIRLNLDDANLLFDEIKELIPPIMQYKLPLEFQNYFIEPIVKSNNFKYYSYFTPIDSISIINEKINSKGNKKYDIETTTQNFFVGSLLVHNSNFSFIWNNETKTL